MAVNGIEIAVGQVWRCRDGQEREIVSNDGHAYYSWGLSDGSSVNDRGWGVAVDMERDRDLIELIRDEHGFMIWKGGPVAPVSGMVEYRLRDGSTFSGAAEGLIWGHDGGPVDLVAYKALTAVSVEPQPNNADADHLASDLLLDLGWRFDGTTWVQDATAPVAKAVNAIDMLDAAAGHMRDRAATYDKPEGERSMDQTVDIFNRFHGKDLTAAQGWHFMQILKDVRLFTRATYHADSAEDAVAYAALKAEAKAVEGGK